MRCWCGRWSFGRWISVVLVAGCGVAAGRLAAQDSFQGKTAGQERSDNHLKMKFNWCPPGKFKMGSPKDEPDRKDNEDQVDVTLTRGFWMGTHEVTQSQYSVVMDENPSTFKGASLPVDGVSWNDATQFCRKLTEKERATGGLPYGWEYRLPTEAQWEYACRAGTTVVSFGDDFEQLEAYAWYGDNSGGETHPVGQKEPNAWKLRDMHGNVWEWCRDWYQDELPGGTDPEVTKRASNRVFRGGGWGSFAWFCRPAFRFRGGPANGGSLLGFRVAIVPSGG